MKKLFTSLMLVIVFTAGCFKLAPEGIYKGDKVLATSEKQIRIAYDAIHTFVLWEYTNRKSLGSDVTNAADEVRKNAERYINTAIALHDAYEAAPTVENKDKLNKAISVLQETIIQLNSYIK